MDPNENLAEQRRIVARIQAGEYADTKRLADLIEALDEWLQNGGSLPKSWRFAYR